MTVNLFVLNHRQTKIQFALAQVNEGLILKSSHAPEADAPALPSLKCLRCYPPPGGCVGVGVRVRMNVCVCS